MQPANRPLRLAVLQRVCPGYRVALFAGLSSRTDVEARLYIGDDLPDSKVKSAVNLGGVTLRRLKTRFIRMGKRVLPWHVDLIGELRKFNPDVVLCEGESHFVGYLQALVYRYLFNRRARLIHWCFISLPGEPAGGAGVRSWIKAFFRKFFDAFVVYSSFSKGILVELGQPAEKIFVATNVCDTQRFIELSDGIKESCGEARAKLGIPDRFTALYTGTLDANKHPEVMLDLARKFHGEGFNFVLLGSGPLHGELRDRVARERLSNVFLPGRVTDDLGLYYRAADVLVLPGRGGIVMSEAMASGLPVIIYQGDGSEYDLVEDRVTGIRLAKGGVQDFAEAIELLARNRELRQTMSRECRALIRNRFTTENMLNQIVRAAQFVRHGGEGRENHVQSLRRAA